MIWELLLPEEVKRLLTELQAVDVSLDDERFLAPWRALFSAGWAARRSQSTRASARTGHRGSFRRWTLEWSITGISTQA
jgi:hypothetical protein